MIITCKSCGTRYDGRNLAPHSVFRCRTCGNEVEVPEPEEAAQPEAGAAPSPPDLPRPATPAGAAEPAREQADFEAQAPRPRRDWSAAAGVWERVRGRIAADPGLSAFTAGVVLLVTAYTMAIIDQAALVRAQSQADLLDLDFRRDSSELFKGLDDARKATLEARKAIADAGGPADFGSKRAAPATAAASDASSEQLKKAQEALRVAQESYQKKVDDLEYRRSLYKLGADRLAQDNIEKQAADADMNRYWYAWVQLPGFLLLFLGCIAFLGAGTVTKRITGAVLLLVSFTVLVMLYMVPGTLRVQGMEGPSSKAVRSRPIGDLPRSTRPYADEPPIR